MRVYSTSGLIIVACQMLCAFAQSTRTPSQENEVVAVPVLVETKSGELAYDLAAKDFSVKDNGIEQRVKLDSGFPSQPLALVLILQTGHGGAAQLGTITHVNGLLDSVLTGPGDQVAVIGVDSRAQLFQKFTEDSDDIANTLTSITPGNSGAALFDGVHLALSVLRSVPNSHRQVIVLVSGDHDHGSNASDIGSLIHDVSARNVSVYSLCFGSGRKSLLGKLNALNPIAMASRAVQEISAQELAQMSGGELYRFNSKKDFEDRCIQLANHLNNRYDLSFIPNDPHPGFHTLQVQVDYPKMNVVSARAGYWIADSGVRESGASHQ